MLGGERLGVPEPPLLGDRGCVDIDGWPCKVVWLIDGG